MVYLTNLGKTKKFETEDEAKRNVKNGDELMVAFSYDEYRLFLEKNQKEIEKLKSYDDLANNLEDNKLLLNEKDKEIARLEKSLDGHKRAVGKWKDKLSGDKGITKSKSGTNVTYLQLNFNTKRDIAVKIIIETRLPINMEISDIREFFEAAKISDIFPELENASEYVISEVFCGKKKDVWSVVIVKFV